MFQFLLYLFVLIVSTYARSPELVALSAITEADKDDSIVITCSASKGSKPITFEWLRNGEKLFYSSDFTIDNKVSASILTFDRIRLEHSGNYSCVATNSDGSDQSVTLLQVKGKFCF